MDFTEQAQSLPRGKSQEVETEFKEQCERIMCFQVLVSPLSDSVVYYQVWTLLPHKKGYRGIQNSKPIKKAYQIGAYPEDLCNYKNIAIKPNEE